MSLKRPMYSVLIASSSEGFNDAMASMLPEASFKPVIYVKNIAAAQRAIAERDFDLVIVNSPLTDDSGTGFAIDCSTSKKAVVLILARSDIHAEVYVKVADYGVFTLPKPMSKTAMSTALRWMITVRERLSRVEKKTTSIEDKMKEIRLVNKAKWVLISKKGMSEPEAHRYIEKEAMNRCVTKTVIAEEIIGEE